MNIFKLQNAFRHRPKARVRLEKIDSVFLNLEQIARKPELLPAVLKALNLAPVVISPESARILIGDFIGGQHLQAFEYLQQLVAEEPELFAEAKLSFKGLSTELSLNWPLLGPAYPPNTADTQRYQLEFVHNSSVPVDQLRLCFSSFERAESVASVLFALRNEQIRTASGPHCCISGTDSALSILRAVWRP